MESPDELKAHQRVEREKVGSWKVESLDELQEDLIKKGGKGSPLGGVARQARVKALG
jgi:hypothetical protein